MAKSASYKEIVVPTVWVPICVRSVSAKRYTMNISKLITRLKRIFSDMPRETAPQKRPPHKVVRTKAQAAQKRLSDMAAKQNGRTKNEPTTKSGPKRGK